MNRYCSTVILLLTLLVSSPIRSLMAAEPDCGAYALQTVASMFGHPPLLPDLRKRLGITATEGTSLLKIRDVARDLGLNTDALKLSPDELLGLDAPAVAFVRGDHFVAIGAVDSNSRHVYVLDQNRAGVWQSVEAFGRDWSGEILIVRARTRAGNGGPMLWMESFEPDLGAFDGVKEEHRTITVLNPGDTVLELSKPMFNCGCAQIELPAPIPPGRAGVMKVTIDTSAKPVGEFRLNLVIHTNERDAPQRMIRLRGNVQRRIAVAPPIHSVGDVPASTHIRRLTSRVFLGRAYGGNISYFRSSPGLRCESIDRDRATGAFDVNMEVDLSKVTLDRNERFVEALYVKTEHPAYQYVELMVVGRKLPVLDSLPRALFLQQRTGDAPAVRQLNIVTELEQVIRVDVADSSIVSATINNRTINVRVPSGRKPGVYRTHLNVTAGEHSIVIPIWVIVRDTANQK